MKTDFGGPSFSFLQRIRWRNVGLALAISIALIGLVIWSLKSSASPVLPSAAARSAGAEFEVPPDLPVEKIKQSQHGAEPQSREDQHHVRRKRRRVKKLKKKAKAKALKKVGAPSSSGVASPPPASRTYSSSPPPPASHGWQHEFSPG